MSKIDHHLSNLLTYLVYLFPLTFIFGNLFTNVFILLSILIGAFVFKKDLFIWNDKIVITLIFSFFIIVLVSTLIQFFFLKEYPDWIKAILYLRFFLFLMVIKTMVQKEVLKLKNFIYSSFFISAVICLDIIIQYVLGYNLVGNSPVSFYSKTGQFIMSYYSGFFNKELIAGGFILMFSVFGIFAVPIFLKNKKKEFISIFFLAIFGLIIISLILSGNRMPVIMFLFFAVLLALIIKNKQYKVKFLILSFCILLVATSIVLNSSSIKQRFKTFFVGVPNPIVIISELKKEYPELEKYKNSGKRFHNIKKFENSENIKITLPFFTGHIQIFITSLDLIIEKPVLGSGIKSFRNNCYRKVHLPNRVCENHPHNFYLDILSDTGILGLSLIVIPVLILLINVYREYLKGDSRNNNISNWVYLAVILSVMIQFFPFKSSGSFFSTFSSGYTFLILGFLLGLNEIRYNKANTP